MNKSLSPGLTYLILMFILACCRQPLTESNNIAPNDVVPTKTQVEYHQMELIGFIHFSLNTFTDKDWGYGDEDPKLFNPTELDAEQWVRTAW